jgi:hypothetical protein
MVSAGARAYRGGLGTLPPVGSRGKAPGGGSGGLRPLKLTIFRYLEGKLYIKKVTVFNICLPNQKAHRIYASTNK